MQPGNAQQWAPFLLNLPTEIRELILYRYLRAAVGNRGQYRQLLRDIARAILSTPNGTWVGYRIMNHANSI
jgi:hypothetical protein